MFFCDLHPYTAVYSGYSGLVFSRLRPSLNRSREH